MSCTNNLNILDNKMGIIGENKFESSIPDFAYGGGSLAYCGCTSLYNQRSSSLKFGSCSCIIHNFAF